MFLPKLVTRRSSKLVYSFCRSVQHRKPIEIIPSQRQKPRFDSAQFEASIKPYAEDVTTENRYEKLCNMILPLANYSYDEQLNIKQGIVEQLFDQIGNAILWDKRIDSQVLKYVEFHEGHFCRVKPIVPSPLTERYRCKDDLSCGYDVDGQKTIGFYINPLNNKKFPNTLCISPIHLKSMKAKHILVVKHFDQFLKQHPLPVCANTNILKKDQYWRTMSLKSNEQGHLMMSVVVHPQSLSKVLWTEIDQIKKDLLNYFIDGPGRECEINSIYFLASAHNRSTSDRNPLELIHGEEFLYETYNGKKLRISPESLFQTNKQASEISFQTVFDHAQLDEHTVLLDIGSGIGIHSIMASPIAKKIYAIDPLKSCIEDGEFNAKLNGCRDNIEWICSYAEANLHRILKKIGDLHGDNSRLVAIINPSRYSLTNKTISIMRGLPSIQQLIYVLNKTDQQVMHNLYELAAGERSKLKEVGRPFIPTDIYPIDMLPHSTNVETIVKCIRV
ncbi:unnamed protein product [Adineta ricciae]|uniref:tRNA (uracil(54)-C(5))-methyltransferase n=1 Tax=Adineta ricciae TaxID=249248 RepID=A0A813TL82_ADIRI|nr:unnamed protein product [Adineta ricciae]